MIKLFFLFLLSISIIFIFKLLCSKFNILVEQSKNNIHKKLLEEKIKKLQIGGILLFFLTFFQLFDIDIYLISSLFFILLLGLFSDINLINSPKLRIILQSIILIYLVVGSSLFVNETRISIIDNLIQNNYFQITFTIFCFLVLVNGSNFIDGVNNLLIIYYLIVTLIVVITCNSMDINFYLDFFKFLSIILFSLAIFNFLSYIIMGDSGAYFLAVLMGYFLILLANNNENISPIFVLNLLWYPAFENLFSIIRKLISKNSPSSPDNYHFHHLLFMFINKKFRIHNFGNSLTGILINSYNLISLLVASKFAHHTENLSIILIFNILIYLIFYFFLKNKVKVF